MATKPIDTSNTGQMNFIPQGNDYGTQVVDFSQDVKSILDVMNDLGYDAFNFNSEVMAPMKLDREGLASTYRVKEFAKFGLGGEYNDQIGVALHTGSVRYIDFAWGKEEYFQPMKYDPVMDGDKAGHATRVSKDYGQALVKNRPMKFLEQVINSGIKFETTADYQLQYDAWNMGFDGPVDPDNMTGAELEQFLIFVGTYYTEMQDVSKEPIVLLGNREWNMLLQSENFVSALQSNLTNEDVLRRNNIGMIHNVVVGNYPQLGLPSSNLKDVTRIVMAPGMVQFQERIIRPVKYRPYSEAIGVMGDKLATVGNKVIDGEFFTGTFEQFCIITDNLRNPSTGDVFETLRYMICGSYVQDKSKVLYGEVRGTAPTVKEGVNRTMAEVIKATFNNEAGTGEAKPATDNGDTHGLPADYGVSMALTIKLYMALSGLSAADLSTVAEAMGLPSTATVDEIVAAANTVHLVEKALSAIPKEGA